MIIVRIRIIGCDLGEVVGVEEHQEGGVADSEGALGGSSEGEVVVQTVTGAGGTVGEEKIFTVSTM